MNQKIYNFFRVVIGFVFPPRCPVCDDLLDEPGEFVHPKCEDMLFGIGSNCCLHCGRALVIKNMEYCPECSKKVKNRIISFTQGKSIWQYRGAMKKCMYRFKYSNKREYADYFAIAAVKKYGNWIRQKKIDAIVPVPMYKGKQRRRGYNQAAVFANALGRNLGINVYKDGVVRVRDTAPMKALGDKERKKNLENAFQINKSIVKCSYILLVDDIYTTGSTADAITQALLKSGVEGVYFLSICTGKEI